MERKNIEIKLLPDTPGVYFFLGPPNPPAGREGGLDPRREILYIGKAASIRNRVRSYFTGDMLAARGPKIVTMLEKTVEVEWRLTDSVLEALLLESYLIKKHQPSYNTDEKDDKSWNYVVITKETFPRVLLVRGKELVSGNREQGTENREQKIENERDFIIRYQFGPFSQGGMLKEALKIVRRIFPYRDRCIPLEKSGTLKEQNPARIPTKSGSVARPHRYAKRFGQAGRACFNAQIGLCPGMCADEITAGEYAKTIHNIKLFFEGKKKTLVKKLEKEMNAAAKQMEFEKASGLKHTLFALEHIQDVALLKKDISNYPLLPQGEGVQRTDEGTHHILKHTLTAPSSQLWKRRRPILSQGERGKSFVRIEAYDVAHLSGQNVVGVMVVIEGDTPNKSQYRKFKLHHGNNDIANLEEMLARRLKHSEWPGADMLVVDGFDLQLQAAEKALRVFGSPIPVVAVVKDRRHQPKSILGSPTLTEKYRDAILLANAEAHRFAITFHRKRRKNSFLPR